ncbi:MAG: hypothetical protein RLY93_11755 [Sumerlaeia bacterium]
MPESYLSFRRAERECLLCGKTLEDLGRHPSVLRFSEKEEALRMDFCPECWEKKAEQDYFGFWLTRRIEKAHTAEGRKLAREERNAALWSLFAALHSESDPALAPQVFLLAHLLMRYRVLTYQKVTRDGLLQFYHSPTREIYEVADMALEDAVAFAEARETIEARLRETASGEAAESLES